MNKNMNAMDTTKFVHKAMEEKTDELIAALSAGLLCVKQARRAEVHLNEDGHTGLVCLMEIFCCASLNPAVSWRAGIRRFWKCC